VTGHRARLLLLAAGLAAAACERAPDTTDAGIEPRDIAAAERVVGLEFTPAERGLMSAALGEQRDAYAALRALDWPNELTPAQVFRPYRANDDDSARPSWVGAGIPRGWSPEDLPWMSVGELGALLRSGEITSVELAEFFLGRLDTHGRRLEAVVTLTRELALDQAARADEELAAGIDRGPLHGIPYGAKDLFAVPGYPTTWGATPYAQQVIDDTATAVEKLQDAGAVLVAKLSLGALAWGDVWFGGKTRNPWNLEEGSRGSSAGSAAAVAAGLVPFALGTETWGSIVSPADRTGIVGFRPGFGRVSRAGAMALSWSMDKVGVLCRQVEDCAMAFDAVRGADPADPASVGGGFGYGDPPALEELRIGYLETDFAADYPGAEQDRRFLGALRAAGVALIPVDLPDEPVGAMSFVLSVEAAAAFDQLTRSNDDDLLVRQIAEAWPNVLRAARLVPAVEYVQADRARTRLVARMHELFGSVDVYLAPSVSGPNLLLTNLTGHPQVAVPVGFIDADSPSTISLVSDYLDEGRLLSVARRLQEEFGSGEARPPGFE
jgi:Asp-tRNA(Asn)/Glu-tRNA(Gln) amidotransferase A subunit family amidase